MSKTLEEWPIYFYQEHPVWSWLHDGPKLVWTKRQLHDAFFKKVAFNLIFALKKKQLNISLIFKIWCSWRIWDRMTWGGWRQYPLTHYNLRTCGMNGPTFTSCLLINTGFRVIKDDFWNKVGVFFHKMFITNSTSATIP